MKVKFILTMNAPEVNGVFIDYLVIEWIDEYTQQEVLDLSHNWITGKGFLTKRMDGLTRVGESTLTIEPIEGEIKEWDLT